MQPAADREDGTATTTDGDGASLAGTVARVRRGALQRCEWCGRGLEAQVGSGRRRKYCGQACRQRAYENRNARTRHELPVDAVIVSAADRDDLADRLYQVVCAAEDIRTALEENASRGELANLVGTLIEVADAAGRIR